MKHLSTASLPQRASSTSQPSDGDNVSMASNVTAEEDATMQETFMGLVSRSSNLIPILKCSHTHTTRKIAVDIYRNGHYQV